MSILVDRIFLPLSDDIFYDMLVNIRYTWVVLGPFPLVNSHACFNISTHFPCLLRYYIKHALLRQRPVFGTILLVHYHQS